VLSALAAWLVARRVGGRVRVAAWKARWPRPLPPTPLLSLAVALASVAAGRQRVWSTAGGSFISDGFAGGSGSAHGRRRHGGRWNTAAASVHVFGGGGAAHDRCWLVERFVEAAAVGFRWQPPYPHPPFSLLPGDSKLRQ
jgi:hypothetical protein